MANEFENAQQPDTDSERVGFCQDCGRALNAATVRRSGSAMFCEPCLELRTAAANAAAGAASGPNWTTVPPVTPGAAPGSGPASAGSMPPGVLPPLGGDSPSPGLAALLGFIPGVGAIYNGQFAKGIAHIVIFAFLSSLGHSSDFFGLLAFLWCCYQSYEAYHTAKARREGLPLPDPFGLNDIGERMGMGKGWPGYATRPGGPVSGQAPGYTAGPYAGGPYASGPYASDRANWGTYVPPAPDAAANPYVAPAANAAAPPPVAAYETPAQEWAPVNAGAPAPVWAATPPPATPVTGLRRFPAGAVWLIALGALFLVFNIEPDWRFSVSKIVPFFLVGLAIWIFVRRMMLTGGLSPADDEGSAYGVRAVASLRAPALFFTVGVLMALQTFTHDWELRVSRTWPVLLLVMGGVLLLERSVGAKALPGQPPIPPPDVSGKTY